MAKKKRIMYMGDSKQKKEELRHDRAVEKEDKRHEKTHEQAEKRAFKLGKKMARKKLNPKGKRKIEKVMHEFKAGKLNIGKSKKKVKRKTQAIAIALSEARKAGARIPKKRK